MNNYVILAFSYCLNLHFRFFMNHSVFNVADGNCDSPSVVVASSIHEENQLLIDITLRLLCKFSSFQVGRLHIGDLVEELITILQSFV